MHIDQVLNERFNKLTRYGVLRKKVYAESPPRVHYELTAFGERFAEILDRIEQLQRDLERETGR